jgi:UDP-N-acetylmuramyl pentapeptide synthase
MNALAAAAVGYYYGINMPKIKGALENYRAYEKRMQLTLAGGVKILNDTYNSNPESANAAIRWLSVVRTKGKRIAVLADMLELGESAVNEHRKIGKEIGRINIDVLFTFGNLAKEIASAASVQLRQNVNAGKGIEIESFDNKLKLSERLLQVISAGDVVLVKGSRGMRMEEVVNALTNELQNKGAV